MKSKSDVARMFWDYFSKQDWGAAKKLLHPKFVAEWPESRERFEGADAFVDMNAAYPGNHVITVLSVIETGDRVVTSVATDADTGQKAFANTWFEFEEGLVAKIVEYWGAPYEPPAWRSQFAKRY